MTTDDLLRQILADPADAALRSVYADALMAAGDPRGELIAVEEALDRPGARERRAALRQAHGAAWWPELPLHRIRSRRGFATGISVAAAEIADCARLFETELIDEVELDNHDLVPLSFAPAPWQAHVTHLAITGVLGRAELKALCASPLGERLESLEAIGCLDGIVALEGGLPRCRRLAIAHANVGHQIGTLLRWRHIDQLEELDVRSCALTAYNLDDLLAMDLASLRVLKLSGNALGDGGTRVLQRRLRHLPRLERLELIDCGASDITHTAITEREDLPASLDLVGATLELVPTTPGRFGLLVDGVRRRLRFRSVRTEDGLPEAVVTDWTVADDAPLQPLYDAIALGIEHRPTPAGAILQLAIELAEAYTAMTRTRETLEVGFGGEVVTLELERHMMTMP